MRKESLTTQNEYAVCTLFQGATACLCCGLKTYGWMFLVYVHAFFGCYAMDSDCSLKGMPLAEWDRNGRVHALSAPLPHIGWTGLLPLPAALGGNPQHSNDKHALFHIMSTLVRSCSTPCFAEIFQQSLRIQIGHFMLQLWFRINAEVSSLISTL